MRKQMIHEITKRVVPYLPGYHALSAQVLRGENASREDLEAFRDRRLQEMVHHCYQKVPYYRDLFHRLRLQPEQFTSPADLERLPMMDKTTVNDNRDKLMPRGLTRWLSTEVETGGTQGIPTRFRRDMPSIVWEAAFIERLFRVAGYRKGMRMAILRGEHVLPTDRETPPFWEANALTNELFLSCYHIRDQHALAYEGAMRSFGVNIAYAFPSTISLLADVFLENGIHYPLSCVITSSEKLTDSVREKVQNAFGCDVVDWYGQTERVSAICQCTSGTYHIMEDYSVTELIPSALGMELVGTSLSNYVMPLLRYRTNDHVELDEHTCPCGSHHRVVKKLLGRDLGYVIDRAGNRYAFFLVDDCIDIEDKVREYQFKQKQPGVLEMHIVPENEYTEQNARNLVKKLKKHTSDDMEIVFIQHESIHRTSRGKIASYLTERPSLEVPAEHSSSSTHLSP